jgi:hypothetical protein
MEEAEAKSNMGKPPVISEEKIETAPEVSVKTDETATPKKPSLWQKLFG